MAQEPIELEKREAQRDSGAAARTPEEQIVQSGPNRPAEVSRGDREPQEIRREIERTRAEMSHTVTEIQERLSPQRLKRQAQEAVQEATIGRAKHVANEVNTRARSVSSTLMDTVRRNPLPAAMVVVGLGWLAVQTSSRSQAGNGRVDYRRQLPSREATMTGVYGGESVGMAETRGRVGEYTEEAKGRVGEMTHEAQERVGEVAHEAQERAKELGYQAQEQAQQARSRIGDFIDENPLAAGVAAFAIGAAIGLAIPETRREQELMGPTRDKLMERARETAEETMEKVQEAAREVRDEGEEEATEQGFVQP